VDYFKDWHSIIKHGLFIAIAAPLVTLPVVCKHRIQGEVELSRFIHIHLY